MGKDKETKSKSKVKKVILGISAVAAGLATLLVGYKVLDSKGVFDKEDKNPTAQKVDDKQDSTSTEQKESSPVETFVDSLLTQKLVKIVGMHTDDGKLYTDAVFDNGRFVQMYQLRTSFDVKVDNLSDAMKHADSNTTRVVEVSNIVDYNSAQSMLDSGDLTGTLKEYSDKGYAISVASSQTALTEYDDTFQIYGTYKVTNGTETKYIHNVVECVLEQVGQGQKSNYTTKVEDPSARSLYEISSYDMTSDMATYFSGLGTSATKSTTRSASTYDGGMSM